MARIGGFTFILLIVCYYLLLAWNHFNSNNQVFESLYTFSTPKDKCHGGDDEKHELYNIVQARGSLNMSFVSWLFCYCCNHKRELYVRAYDRRDKELDITKLV
jgi:hypothetical protein